MNETRVDTSIICASILNRKIAIDFYAPHVRVRSYRRTQLIGSRDAHWQRTYASVVERCSAQTSFSNQPTARPIFKVGYIPLLWRALLCVRDTSTHFLPTVENRITQLIFCVDQRSTTLNSTPKTFSIIIMSSEGISNTMAAPTAPVQSSELRKAIEKAVQGGKSGAMAMTIQVRCVLIKSLINTRSRSLTCHIILCSAALWCGCEQPWTTSTVMEHPPQKP